MYFRNFRFHTEGEDILMSLFEKSFIKNSLKDEEKLIHKKPWIRIS